MANLENFKAFALAAELGSFSAAARQMKKAQSAISTSIANLEIDIGMELFDRSGRNPVLTEAGRTLLPHAIGILMGHKEFMAKATSMTEGVEGHLCLAIEQGISLQPLMYLFEEFNATFKHVSLEILSPGPNDTATLLKEGRAHLGLMTEQENYPTGFQFRGVGYTKLVPVCGPKHPLANLIQVEFGDLRQYRQLIPRSRSLVTVGQLGERKSASVWYAESPFLIMDLLLHGLGWAELPFSVIAERINSKELIRLHYSFQQSDILEGIDVVWTEKHALGTAGQWMRTHLLELPQDVWREHD